MKICIVGTGYVGLVSAACFAEMGNNVVCIDKNPHIIESLKQGHVHIYEPGLEELVLRNHTEGRLSFTVDLAQGMKDADVIFICVGTPPLPDGSCDLRFVHAVASEIGLHMSEAVVVVDKSTVPVGTADTVTELIQSELDKRGVSPHFSVVSNPEFLKEGDAVADFMKPDRVVLGTSSQQAVAVLKDLYAPFARSREKIIVMSARSAEMTKYAANCMLATKISFINEIANVCEKVGADVRDVRAGIGSDHRIGHHFIYPGLGYGGSCFPKDVKALIHIASSVGVAPELLLAVNSVNKRQKEVMATRILDFFASQGGVKGKTLALWGLSFKANTDDMREAASIAIVTKLTEAGMNIVAYDPEAGKNAKNEFKGNELIKIADDQYECLHNASALLVATEWNQFRTPDFAKIKSLLKIPVIFDGRNLYVSSAVCSEGFIYHCIGKR